MAKKFRWAIHSPLSKRFIRLHSRPLTEKEAEEHAQKFGVILKQVDVDGGLVFRPVPALKTLTTEKEVKASLEDRCQCKNRRCPHHGIKPCAGEQEVSVLNEDKPLTPAIYICERCDAVLQKGRR